MYIEKTGIWTNEKVLLSRIEAGDEYAFRVLYDRYRMKLYSYALKIIKSEILAEDILHEVFLKIWQHEKISDIDNIEAYLKVITRNHTLKALRRHQLEIHAGYVLGKTWQEAHNETEESVLLNDSKNILKQGIEMLPPQQKLVYNLCREEGLKYEEAARHLSISPLTVKTHMQHALRFLRGYLSKYTDVSLLLILIQLLIEKK